MRFAARAHGPFGKSPMKGSMTVVDENNMEWCWSEHVMGGLKKTMEMCGTSTRK